MRKSTKQIIKTRRQGLTLIELIIYLALVAIISVVVIDLVTRVFQNRQGSRGQSEVAQNARFVLDRLTYSAQRAKIIAVTTPPDRLSLQITGSPNLIFTLSPTGQILYDEGAGDVSLTTDDIEVSRINIGENIFEQLTNTDAQSVQVRFKVTFKATGFSQDIQTSILGRGK